MNITIRNLGFSTQNHNAGIARKPVQSKPDVFIKNQDKLSFGRIKRVISTADELFENVRQVVTSNADKDGDLFVKSLETSGDVVKRILVQTDERQRITQFLSGYKGRDGTAECVAYWLGKHGNTEIIL